MLPLELLPGPIKVVADVSPFRFMLSVPVELMTESIAGGDLAQLMLGQLGWAAASLVTALWLWRVGLRRFESVGG
jgi:ABC-2 type transport system permease protein